jgi:putative DNA primase/helicase
MTPNDPPSFETVRAALACIPPDIGHDQRVRLAFAVFDGLGEAGADLWQGWAAGRAKPNAAEDRATWRSARKPGPVKVGTLFGIAKEHGFTFEAVQTPAPPPTPAELKARADARRAAAEREQAATEERHRQAAADARRLWDSAAEVTDPAAVPYLVRKGVKPYGVRCLSDGTLVVPARTVAGELVNVQRILAQRPAEGIAGKLFTKGARKAGTLHLIGMPAEWPGALASGCWWPRATRPAPACMKPRAGLWPWHGMLATWRMWCGRCAAAGPLPGWRCALMTTAPPRPARAPIPAG